MVRLRRKDSDVGLVDSPLKSRAASLAHLDWPDTSLVSAVCAVPRPRKVKNAVPKDPNSLDT